MLDSRALAILWAIEVPIAIYNGSMGLVSFLNMWIHDTDAPKSFKGLQTIFILIDILGIILLTSEIAKLRKGRLHPLFFTLSHGVRAARETVGLVLLLSLSRGPMYYGTLSLLTKLLIAASLITYYTGFFYGVMIWYSHQRAHRSVNGSWQDFDTEATSLIPKRLNVASQLRSRNTLISKIVRWIYTPAFKSDTWPERSIVLINTANYLVVPFKWIAGSIALIPMILSAGIFPGEQYNRLIGHIENVWDYPRPNLRQHDRYTDEAPVGDGLRERQLVASFDEDEESQRPADLMSLHSVAEPIRQPKFSSVTTANVDEVSERLLGPRYLCFLDEMQPKGYTTRGTEDRAAETGNHVIDYVFVSYTRRQFYTTIKGDPSLPADINSRLQAAADHDMRTLIEFAIAATKAAAVNAFWIDYECVQPEAAESADKSMEDVYRICDIVRSCHSMAIIVGPKFNYSDYSHEEVAYSSTAKAEWLHDWGRRLWTVPEALLCPGEHRISIFAPGAPEPELVAKRNLPGRVWDDAASLRQLIDHYESSIHLTKLELITIALDCLKNRITEKRMKGDVAYALQGLLRQRPKVVSTDTDFQAFARLSMANDNDMLLERLICLKLRDNRAPWHEMRDVWGAKLWDIFPVCQIADVVEDNTVILGDAKGATINWSHLEPVQYEPSKRNILYWGLIRQGPIMTFGMLLMLIFALSISAHGSGDLGESVIQKIVISIFSVVLCSNFLIPATLKYLYKTDVRSTQARFFGIAGRPDLSRVEQLLFGVDTGRLHWVGDTNNEASGGQQTYTDTELLEEQEDEDGLRSFTLIDSCTLSATTFKAELPPTVAIACARARGLVRVLLCSYDGSSDRLCKEAVLRMETVVLERMPKLERVRFTLKQPLDDLEE